MSGPNRDKNVGAWLDSVDISDVYFSVSVIMEQNKGIVKAKKNKNCDLAKNRASLDRLEKFISDFWDHFILINHEIAMEWGRLVGIQEKSVLDKLVAATANVNEYSVVTRDTGHDGFANKTIDPFKPPKVKKETPLN
jgi:toxin FitB